MQPFLLLTAEQEAHTLCERCANSQKDLKNHFLETSKQTKKNCFRVVKMLHPDRLNDTTFFLQIHHKGI